MRPHLAPRPGSVLASAIGLTTVFVTLIVGTMAYVSTSVANTRADRLRASAEDAAYTGMDLILGWAEQSIDREVILPRPWERMQDQDVIDPIKYLAEGQLPAGSQVATLDDVTSPGQLVGGNNVRELVLGVTRTPLGAPLYITTIKARIQQFRISDNTPRQFRVCVVGRVRRVQTGFSGTTNRTAFNAIDSRERESIVAERALITTIGRETTSRYAALIDCDLVRNWVPGEVVSGPVHINRGYPDGTGFLDDGVELATAGAVPGIGLSWADFRSRMDLNIDGQPGNPGFRTPAGARSYPVFNARVSMTEMRGDARYRNNDPARTAAPICIRVNGQPWFRTTAAGLRSNHLNIFRDPENAAELRFGGAGVTLAGPKIINQPIELPRSVRNGLGAATGRPGEYATSGRWEGLEDGLYVPTARFWAGPPYGTPADPPDPSCYDGTLPPSGGIYIRGNVEAMRMAISPNRGKSVYLFQVGSYNLGRRRCYMVVADRQTRRLTLHAWPGNAAFRLHGNVIPTAGTTISALEGQAGWDDVAGQNPRVWGLSGTGKLRATLAPPVSGRYPFNGIIFVDCAQNDPARSNQAGGSAHNSAAVQPTSGHILALGNLGNKTDGRNKNSFRIENQVADVVSTLEGTVATAPASKLNILARGNIFIQNHLLVDGIFRSNGIGPASASGAQYNGASVNRANLNGLSLSHTRDLLGIVSDQRVVMGLHAPSAARGSIGCTVMAAIAALGDPAWQPWNSFLSDDLMRRPGCYVGSFGTEGLMQSQGYWENYWIPKGAGRGGAAAAWDYTPPIGGPTAYTDAGLYYSTKVSAGGYPGNPIYEHESYSTPTQVNPNYAPRGRLLAFGSLTQKRRGIIGTGNNSYDKDFVFDPRLLTIAPPLFPASLNIVVRTQTPFTPDEQLPERRLPYRGSTQAGLQASDPLAFMGVASGAMD
ncbi:MAG: hypothetical protein VKQ33_06295 [Candidatus Sericytochromatia bacterium]|nr:hypothetical protein [Candidatus Sericytochromatia bacterium]